MFVKEDVGIAGDGAQGRAQIMGHGVRERLEFLVGGLEFVRAMAESVLGELPLRDVFDHGANEAWRPPGVAHEAHGLVDPGDGPVLADDALFALVIVLRSQGEIGQHFAVGSLIVDVAYVSIVATAEIVAAAQKLVEGAVRLLNPPIQVDLDKTDGDRFEQGAEDEEGLVGLAASDIEDGPLEVEKRPCGGADHPEVLAGDDAPSILAPPCRFDATDILERLQATPHFGPRRVGERLERRERGRLERAERRISQHPQERGVGREDLPIGLYPIGSDGERFVIVVEVLVSGGAVLVDAML